MPRSCHRTRRGRLVDMRREPLRSPCSGCPCVCTRSRPGADVRRCRRVTPDPKPKVARIVAVGDIACDPDRAPTSTLPVTASTMWWARSCKRMVKRGADWFITLGDAQYEYGTYHDFRAEFHPAFRTCGR